MLAPDVNGLLADLVPLGRGGHRRGIGLAQHGHHRLFAESTLPHGFHAAEETSSQESKVRKCGRSANAQ